MKERKKKILQLIRYAKLNINFLPRPVSVLVKEMNKCLMYFVQKKAPGEIVLISNRLELRLIFISLTYGKH